MASIKQSILNFLNQTHLIGYATGLVAAVVGACSHLIGEVKAETPLIYGGLGTLAITVASKLLADAGFSKASLEADLVKVEADFKALETKVENFIDPPKPVPPAPVATTVVVAK